MLKDCEVHHRDGRTETLRLDRAGIAGYRAQGARVVVPGEAPAKKAAPRPANKARTAPNKRK